MLLSNPDSPIINGSGWLITMATCDDSLPLPLHRGMHECVREHPFMSYKLCELVVLLLIWFDACWQGLLISYRLSFINPFPWWGNLGHSNVIDSNRCSMPIRMGFNRLFMFFISSLFLYDYFRWSCLLIFRDFNF